eukprot:CAMPEP_0204157160 /NCGR_PEP_ID=MMETSP0361-20130328/31014_1 /ASSEMBLY_ACC=CAM_ASM_000343 /TAXON_ID=268821 /ORGANISM="Scrippsiella Hangoei, Strain SHTV-5" /LENGTH=117 /DNA_ID=CAMNT_0051112893 /DNA_START=20 /DNA_END=369 /DNA_ORIENTATION=+
MSEARMTAGSHTAARTDLTSTLTAGFKSFQKPAEPPLGERNRGIGGGQGKSSGTALLVDSSDEDASGHRDQKRKKSPRPFCADARGDFRVLDGHGCIREELFPVDRSAGPVWGFEGR